MPTVCILYMLASPFDKEFRYSRLLCFGVRNAASWNPSSGKPATLLANDHAEAKFVVFLGVVQLCREHKVDTHIDSFLKEGGNLQAQAQSGNRIRVVPEGKSL